MYQVTPTWCCEFGSIYRNGRCQSPDPPHVADAPTDPMVGLGILAVIMLVVLAWYDSHSRQVTYAREIGDTLDEADDIAAAARRMEAAAADADEILRRYRQSARGDDA